MQLCCQSRWGMIHDARCDWHQASHHLNNRPQRTRCSDGFHSRWQSAENTLLQIVVKRKRSYDFRAYKVKVVQDWGTSLPIPEVFLRDVCIQSADFLMSHESMGPNIVHNPLAVPSSSLLFRHPVMFLLCALRNGPSPILILRISIWIS